MQADNPWRKVRCNRSRCYLKPLEFLDTSLLYDNPKGKEEEKMTLEMINTLIGKQVVFIRAAGNSLIIYLESMPSEEKGFSIWLEPTWHLHDNKKVLLGSRQLQTDDNEELNEITRLLEDLYSKEVKEIEINRITNDITIKIEQYELKTFVADANDEYIWQLRDRKKKTILEANPNKIFTKGVSGN